MNSLISLGLSFCSNDKPNENDKLLLDRLHEDLEQDFIVENCFNRWGKPLIMSFINLLQDKGLELEYKWFESLSYGRCITAKYPGCNSCADNQLRVDFKYMAALTGKKGLIPTMNKRLPSTASKKYWDYLKNNSSGCITPNLPASLTESYIWRRHLNLIKSKANPDKISISKSKIIELSSLSNRVKIIKNLVNEGKTLRKRSKKFYNKHILKGGLGNLEKEKLENEKVVVDFYEKLLPEKHRSVSPEYTPLSNKYKEALMKKPKINFVKERLEKNVLQSTKKILSKAKQEIKDKKPMESKADLIYKKNMEIIRPKRSRKIIIRRDCRSQAAKPFELEMSNRYETLDKLEKEVDSKLEEINGKLSSSAEEMCQMDFENVLKFYEYCTNGKNKYSKRQKLSRKSCIYSSAGFKHPHFGKQVNFRNNLDKFNMDMTELEGKINLFVNKGFVYEEELNLKHFVYRDGSKYKRRLYYPLELGVKRKPTCVVKIEDMRPNKKHNWRRGVPFFSETENVIKAYKEKMIEEKKKKEEEERILREKKKKSSEGKYKFWVPKNPKDKPDYPVLKIPKLNYIYDWKPEYNTTEFDFFVEKYLDNKIDDDVKELLRKVNSGTVVAKYTSSIFNREDRNLLTKMLKSLKPGMLERRFIEQCVMGKTNVCRCGFDFFNHLVSVFEDPLI